MYSLTNALIMITIFVVCLLHFHNFRKRIERHEAIADARGSSLFHELGNCLSLAVHVFYLTDSNATFVVTKDDPAKIAAVIRWYKKAIRVTEISMICDHSIRAISLSIPNPVPSGWSIRSAFIPAKIKMEIICGYTPGKVPPNIELLMRWEGAGPPKEECMEIGIIGGDIESFNLCCKPVTVSKKCSPLRKANLQATLQPEHRQQENPSLDPSSSLHTSQTQTQVQSQTTTSATPTPPAAAWHIPSNSDKPIMKFLDKFPTKSGNTIKVMQEMTTQYRSLGINLLDDEDGAITLSIMDTNHHQPGNIVFTILSRWLRGEGREPKTWATLIEVLHEIDLSELARDIGRNL